MSSPFAVLRRNQKVLLAVFGVIIMIVFVVGSAFDDFFRARAPEVEDATIVRWKHGTLGQLDLAVMRHRNDVMSHFLNEVLKRTQERKGTPKVAPLGRAGSEEELVRRMVLARKAKDQGIVISDDAVYHYLSQLSDTKLSGRDYSEIIAGIPNRRIGEQQIFEELRLQLAADNLARMTVGRGWYAMAPGTAWDLFNRIHHRVQIEALPLNVDDYKGEVADPSDAELKKFYEEHKDSFSHPDFPDAGFRRRPQAAFEYLKIEFDKFVDQEKAKLKDEELRAEYDKRVSRGEFKTPELPTSPNKPAEEPADEKPEDAKPGDKPADEKPTDEKPADKPADEKPADKPADEKPADKPADEKPADEKPADEKPAEKPEAKPADESEKKPECQDGTQAEAGKPEDKPAEKPAETPADKPAEKSDEKPEPKSDEKPAADKPAADKPEDKPADKPEEKPADKPEEKPEVTPEAKPDEQPAKPKVRPFEEVRDEIALSLARPRAQEAFEKTKAAAKKELDTFAREYRIWSVNRDLPEGDPRKAKSDAKDGASTEPPKLDAKALGGRYGFVHGTTPLVDALTVLDYELGQGSMVSFFGGFRQIGFNQIAFREGVPLYTIEEIPGQDPNITFMYWKTDEKEARTPPLDEIRQEVIDVWKRRNAVDKAKAAAEAMAKEAAGKESLKAVFGDKVLESNEFSWMTSGSVGFGMGMPSISRVENIDTPGAGFMEAVFSLKPGEAGVAVNHPRTKVYVVRIAREATSEEVRRTRFIMFGMSNDVAQLAQFEGERAIVDWFNDLEKEMQVEWVDRPKVAMSDE